MEDKIKQIDESINELLNIIEKLILKKEKLLNQKDEAPALVPINSVDVSAKHATETSVESAKQTEIPLPDPTPIIKEFKTCSTNKINNEKEETSKSLLDMFEDDDGIFDRRRQAHLKYYGK